VFLSERNFCAKHLTNPAPFRNRVRYTRARNHNLPRGRTARMAVNTEQVVLEGTGGEFLSLEEKVYRTIELLKSAREAKTAAEKVAERLREQLETAEEELATAKSQLISLKKEREDVRARVEKMVEQMDSLVAEEE
ncbi:MAG TPA: hypothetical protein VF135_09990, partial [Terriglobales bacterium]